MAEHSPTPWKNAGITWEGDGSAGIALFDANDQMVAFVTDWPEFGQNPSEETEANAAMILRAVNTHHALLAMLRRVRVTCHLSEDPTLGSDIDRLIAEAEGREYVDPEEDDEEEPTP